MTDVPPRGTFDETMGEISGFGGGYEAACRQMLRQGLAWLDANPDKHPSFRGFKNVMGLCLEDNEDAKELSAAMCADVDPTGAMHHACVQACLFIRVHGWEKYVAGMREHGGGDR